MSANVITGYRVRTNTENGYAAPETLYVCLAGGEVETRGRLHQTGWIVSLTGNVAQTLSGSTYELGEPAEGTAAEAAEAIREALSRLQSGEATGSHPTTLAYILRS
jgi:hypothetical protein